MARELNCWGGVENGKVDENKQLNKLKRSRGNWDRLEVVLRLYKSWENVVCSSSRWERSTLSFAAKAIKQTVKTTV